MNNKFVYPLLCGAFLFTSCGGKNNKASQEMDPVVVTDSVAAIDSLMEGPIADSVTMPRENPEYIALMKEIYKKDPEKVYKDKDYKQLFCKGKFDGENEDRIGLFPIGLSKSKEANGLTWDRCKSVKLLSENGTTPELVLNWPTTVEGIPFSDGFHLTYDGLSSFTIKSKSNKKTGKDILKVEYFAGEGGVDYFYATYELKDGKWEMTELINKTEEWVGGEEGEEGGLDDVTYKWNGKKWIKI